MSMVTVASEAFAVRTLRVSQAATGHVSTMP